MSFSVCTSSNYRVCPPSVVSAKSLCFATCSHRIGALAHGPLKPKQRLTFMTLKSTSWPKLSFSLKNSCSGYVRAMSRRISFSHGDVIFSSSEYWSLMGMFCALHSSCHTMARKWWGTPFLTRSCRKRKRIEHFEEVWDNKSASWRKRALLTEPCTVPLVFIVFVLCLQRRPRLLMTGFPLDK